MSKLAPACSIFFSIRGDPSSATPRKDTLGFVSPTLADALGSAADSTTTPLDVRSVAHLVSGARAARETLGSAGRSLSRDNLADAMRDAGHGVSNARASLLLKILKAEQDTTDVVPAAVQPSDPQLEVVA